MREPHVERFWGGDLYISPVEVLSAAPGGPEVALGKGESHAFADARVTFRGFAMRRTAEEIRVVADVEVERPGGPQLVQPAVVVNAAGRSSVPAVLAGGVEVSLTEVDAGGERATLAVSGPGSPALPEALAVEVSTKPLILLVWAGMGITLIGALLAILRRSRGPGGQPAAAA
jgi:cytochrome c biogenesis factor